MPTTVFFVRHGSHDRLDHILCGRMEGVELSEAGLREAVGAAERLSREKVGALYVSPLLRARQTAEPIAETLGLPPVQAEDLNEIDLGDWTGATFSDLSRQPAWRSWNRWRGHHRPPGGESMLELQLRVVRWLNEALARHLDTGVVAVCHAEVIKVAAAYALGVSLDHHDRMEIAPGSVSVLEAGKWGLKVRTLNEIVSRPVTAERSRRRSAPDQPSST